MNCWYANHETLQTISEWKLNENVEVDIMVVV